MLQSGAISVYFARWMQRPSRAVPPTVFAVGHAWGVAASMWQTALAQMERWPSG